jgi:hypothetical protein
MELEVRLGETVWHLYKSITVFKIMRGQVDGQAGQGTGRRSGRSGDREAVRQTRGQVGGQAGLGTGWRSGRPGDR